MKKLIKRLEELAVEINELKKTISQLSSIQEVKDKVFNELDSQDFKRGDVLIRELKYGDTVDYLIFDKKSSVGKKMLIGDYYEVNNGISYKNYNYGVFIEDWRKATQEEIDKLNKLLGKEKPKEEERPKTTSTYEELGSQDFKKEENKELEEAKEYLSGYAKGAYPIKPKLKKSIEIILKNLDNESKN